jgi:hypothetical protein
MDLHSPSEYAQASSRRVGLHRVQRVCSSSHEVLTPTASPRPKQWHCVARVCLTRAGLRLQVFSTSWRFCPPRACWPYFMPDPLMGFTLQSVPPLARPYAVSGAIPLMTLGPPAKPRDRIPTPLHRSAQEQRNGYVRDPQSIPRLQGVAPRESPPPTDGGLDRRRHVALMGLSSFRVLTPAGMSVAFTTPPLMWFSKWIASDPQGATPGSCFQQVWLASLETADPPGVYRLVTEHSRLNRTRLGSLLLRARGSSPSPSAHP